MAQETPGVARGAREGLVCRTRTRRGRAWKEVSSLVGTARCSPPSLTAARPLGGAGGSPFPRGVGRGGPLYGLPQAESFGEPGAQGRVDTAGRRALPPPHPTVPPPSLRSWLLARSCARARSLSLQSLLRAQYPLRFVPEGRSITCPVLTDFRIREKAFIPSEFSPSLRAHGLKPLLE